jgi:hypothetical protein
VSTHERSWTLARWWAWLDRAWAHRRLHRGQCAWCLTVLPDDAPAGYCSQACAIDSKAW